MVHPLKMDNGEVLTDIDSICQSWKEYFQKLYTPEDTGKYDNDFKTFVEMKLAEFGCDANMQYEDILREDFSCDEVLRVIKCLKNNKAAGWDGVTAEHVKYGGEALVLTITKLCNIITRMEHIPWQFKIGLLIPIPKGDKNQSYQDNFRGITLLPTLSKIVEKCFMVRICLYAILYCSWDSLYSK